MFRIALRTLPRRLALRPGVSGARGPLRHLATAPPHEQSRSWKNSAARWGIALAGIYYYNTSTAFAQEPPAVHAPEDDGSNLPTLDALRPSARAPPAEASSSVAIEGAGLSGAEDLEEDAHSEGAFNEETGEINWDCPCLGGMAHGPCGDEFREAFSCFVFSKEEPKGMDCIEKFKGMQNCFRQYPDVYGAELDDEEDGEFDDGDLPEGQETPSPGKALVREEGSHVAAAQPDDTQSVAAVAARIKQEAMEKGVKETAGEKKQSPNSEPAVKSHEQHQMKRKQGVETEVETQADAQPLKAQADAVPVAAHDARAAAVPKKS